MKIKYLLFATIMAVGILFAVNTNAAKESSAQDCLAVVGGTNYSVAERITCLQNLIVDLQAKIQQLLTQQGTQTWCHAFNTNLRIGDSAGDVQYLGTALTKEGFNAGAATSEGAGYYFNEQTASAVVEFQEKYASEVLTPSGLKRGTGYVGPAARKKLNALYGCNQNQIPNQTQNNTQTQTQSQNPDIWFSFPWGGEKLIKGNKYTISWTGTNSILQINQLAFDVWKNGDFYKTIDNSSLTNFKAMNYGGSIDWTIPTNLPADSYYKMRLTYMPPNGTALNPSYFSKTFSIIDATITNIYSFKTTQQWDPSTQQHADYSVEIYKNGALVKTVSLANSSVRNYTFVEPTLFTVSPDQKYVAFKVVGYGGTCVYFESPLAIELNNFSIVDFDNSDINIKLGAALGIDPSNAASKASGFSSSMQKLNSIKWVANNKIEASMNFGDQSAGGCPIQIGSNYNSANYPTKVEANVNFIVK